VALTEIERPRARAVLRNYRASAFKVREVLSVIRGKPVDEAIRALSLVNRGPAEAVGKLLASAVANATVQHGLGVGDMVVRLAYADEGATYKRFRPRARGRATRIRKRTCHITIVLEEMTPEERQRVTAARGQRAMSRERRVASSRRSRRQGEARSAASTPTVEPAASETVVPASQSVEASTVAPAETAGSAPGVGETGVGETGADVEVGEATGSEATREHEGTEE
jgi:large subunit ribosomal protein L22